MRHVIAALFIGMFLLGFGLVTESYARSCSSENAKCVNFCKKKRPTSGCFNDCAARQNSCLKTGTYPWNSRANATGLKRCCGGRVAGGTCTAQNKQCLDYCKRTFSGGKCTATCRGRQSHCLKTGTYRWRSRPDHHNLIRK